MKQKTFIISFLLFSLIISLLSSCGSKENNGAETSGNENTTQVLYDYFVENGNYINSEGTPAVMTAAGFIEIMNKKDILVIDLRNAEDFAAGHIKGAINVQPADVPDFFRNHIDAPSFDRIVFLCNRGQLSAYVNGIMRLLGNANTWSVRYGLSSLKAEFAKGWDSVIGNHAEATADTANHPFPQQSSLPAISVQGDDGYQIASIQARNLLSQESNQFLIEYAEVIKNPSDYFIVAYVSPDHYSKSGHLPGAVRYAPTKSLSIDKQLLTLPADKPIVVYCFNGHHSAYATAYLRMLGYDARSILYGANRFMHGFLEKNDQGTPRYWSDAQKNDIPFTTGQSIAPETGKSTTKVKSAAGGC
jgi:rhodanese-related sulfurtransferase